MKKNTLGRLFHPLAQAGKEGKVRATERQKKLQRLAEYKRIRRIRKRTVPAHKYCQNCGTELHGMYCSACGQYARDTQQTFWNMIGSFMESTFQFDGKIIQTLRYLCFRPGYLTSEFLKGRIKSYVHPIKLYLFLSMLLFGFVLLFTDNTDKIKYDGLSITSSDNAATDSVIGTTVITFMNKLDTTRMSAEDKQELNEARQLLLNKEKLQPKTEGEEQVTEEEVDKPMTENEKKMMVKDMREFFYKYMPFFILVLMPFYALLLWGAYHKSHPHYMTHLIFSVHLHTFFILAVIVAELLNALFHAKVFSWTFYLSLLYHVVAMRMFYRHSWPSAVGKTLLCLFAYIFIIAVFAVLFMLIAATVLDRSYKLGLSFE